MNEISLRPAHEARAAVEAMTVALAEAHIAAAVEAIEEAITTGRFEAELYLAREMHPAVMRQLRNAGYAVRRSGPDGYSISWRF